MIWHKQEMNQFEKIEVKKNNKKIELDPKGYFLIRMLPEKKLIELGFCNSEHQLLYVWESDSPIDLCKAVDEKNILSSIAHGMYLGRELERAFYCLEQDLDYVQD